MDKGDYNGALNAYNALEKPTDEDKFFTAVCYSGLKDYDKSIALLTEMRRQQSEYPYIDFALASLYEKKKDYDKSAYFYKQAMKHKETYDDARDAYGFVSQQKELDDDSDKLMELKPFKSSTTFADVVGLEDVKKKLFAKMIYPLQHPEAVKEYGKDFNSGILLYGSAGNGKTMLARAIAGETKGYMIVAQIRKLEGQYVGITEKNIGTLFQQARMNAPCIIFIDEFDVLGGKRSGYGGSDEHGGCLIGNERILLGDGTIKKIKDFGDTHLQKINVPVYQGFVGTHRNACDASVFHHYKNKEIIEITTESGKSIKGTPNHPLLVGVNKYPNDSNWHNIRERWNDEWKPLENIQIGDKVKVIHQYKCTQKTYIKTNFKEVQSRRPNHKVSLNRMELPKYVTPELGAFLGYNIGDGWITKYQIGAIFADDEKDLIPQYETIIKKTFKAQPRTTLRLPNPNYIHTCNGKIIRSKQSVTNIILNSIDLVKNLSFLNTKEVPQLIFSSNDEVVSEFLKWLFTADGSVNLSHDKRNGKTRPRITLTSVNIELLRDVQMLLLRWGIQAKIIESIKYKRGDLRINRGRDVILFKEKIGFACKKKIVKLEGYVKYIDNYDRHFKNKIYEKVVSVKHLDRQDVYDIEVPQSHRFIANGMVSHNTSTLKQAVNALLEEMDGIEKNPEGIMLICATNRPWDIDPALLREGRLGTSIYLRPPNYKERIASFKYNLSKKHRVSKHINYGRLARATDGYSQADIKAIANEAAELAMMHKFSSGKDVEISMGKLLLAIRNYTSSSANWFFDAKKELIGSYQTQIIDKKKHQTWKSAKLEPEEMVRYKELIKDINRNAKSKGQMRMKELMRKFALYIF